MLGVDTVIRTPEGERTIGSLPTGAIVYDSHNREIEVEVGPPIEMERPYEVEYYSLHHNEARAGRAGLQSYTCDADHPLLLVAPTYVSAFAPTQNDARRRVTWQTRCVGYMPTDEEIAQEALRLDLPEEHEESDREDSTRQGSQRIANLGLGPLLASSSPSQEPSSDPSWHSRSDSDRSDDADNSDDSDAEMLPPPAPSSDDWLQNNNYSPALINRVRGRLDNEQACTRKAVRTFTLLCGNEAQAAHIRDALRSQLSAHVDPGALLAGEAHVLTAQQYVDSPHVKKSNSGAPVPGQFLKMGRFPHELLPATGVAAADLPLDPQWLGWWYGDGNHDHPTIAAAASDEAPVRRKCQAIVADLNAHKPEGADPVHLAVTFIPANDSGAVVSRQDC